MSTKSISIKPLDGWESIYTGPTAKPIAIEKGTGTSTAFLAINTESPSAVSGHRIDNGKLKNVVLEAGENLYARCIDGLSPISENIFIITD